MGKRRRARRDDQRQLAAARVGAGVTARQADQVQWQGKPIGGIVGVVESNPPRRPRQRTTPRGVSPVRAGAVRIDDLCAARERRSRSHHCAAETGSLGCRSAPVVFYETARGKHDLGVGRPAAPRSCRVCVRGAAALRDRDRRHQLPAAQRTTRSASGWRSARMRRRSEGCSVREGASCWWD